MSELADVLRPFAELCEWLEDEPKIVNGVLEGTQDFEIMLEGEGFMSGDYVTAGMIRRAREALAGLDNG
jgi:hypothetical protein